MPLQAYTETQTLRRYYSYSSKFYSTSDVRLFPNQFKKDFQFYRNSKNSPRVNGKLQLVPQPLTFWKVQREETPYTEIYSESTPASSTYQTWEKIEPVWLNLQSQFPLLFTAGDTNEVVLDWYDRVADSKANLAEMFATRQQTIDMIGKAARDIASSARALRRGNFRDAARHLGVGDFRPKSQRFSDRWLELQYGWKPLLGSIYDALEAPSPNASRVVTARKTFTRPFSYNEGRTTNGVYLDCNAQFNMAVTVSALITMTNSSLQAANAYGITNPALLAWELVPYSFVVDWFLPIGTWISAQTALSGVQVSESSITTTSSYDITYQTKGGTGLPSSTTIIPGTKREVYSKKERSLSIPHPSFPRPDFQLSTSHALNAIALLASAFRRN